MSTEKVSTVSIGTKLVELTTMSRAEYNEYRGWALPDSEDGDEEGYLVEYSDGGASNDGRHAGYISWSPKDVADRHYRPVDGMTFGMAIEAARLGKKISRAGWNGKGMWVIYNPGSSGQEIAMTAGSIYYNQGLEAVEILPYFDMFTVNANGRRAMLPGWLASQTDLLAEDWGIV